MHPGARTAPAATAAEAAEKVLNLTRDRYQRGLSAPYELVQATDSWLRSSSELFRARAEAALAHLRLELVMERQEE